MRLSQPRTKQIRRRKHGQFVGSYFVKDTLLGLDFTQTNKPRLLQGDCVHHLDKLESESIDLVLTDPPYNLGLFMKNRATNLSRMRENYFGAAGWDNAPPEQWEQLMSLFFEKLVRTLKPGATVVVFMAILKVETIVRLAEEHGLYYKTTGIWHKTNPMPRNMNLHFVNSTEPWIYFTYKARRGTFNNGGTLRHDFIESSATPGSEKKHGKHPTQKPLVILKYFVRLLSNPGDTVLDPFMGSGSSGVAATTLNRNFIGIELDEEYFEIAKKRIIEVRK